MAKSPKATNGGADPEVAAPYVSPRLVIRSKVAGFRRAGIAHAADPIDWPAGSFTLEQASAIAEEPMLMVKIVDETAEAEDA